MVKKFFKTYYSLPDKRHRVDIVFERGYKAIQVLFDGKEITTYPTAGVLLESQELITPDEHVLHIRFLKDSVEFEVFLDGIQIDNSETSPIKIVKSLKWPIYVSMSWYLLIFVLAAITVPELFVMMLQKPILLITEPLVIYSVTSSLVVLAILVSSLVTLKYGYLSLYYVALIAISIDLIFGLLFRLPELLGGNKTFFLTLIFGYLLPIVFKSAVIWSFQKNAAKYRQYSKMKMSLKPKRDADLVDIS